MNMNDFLFMCVLRIALSCTALSAAALRMPVLAAGCCLALLLGFLFLEYGNDDLR